MKMGIFPLQKVLALDWYCITLFLLLQVKPSGASLSLSYYSVQTVLVQTGDRGDREEALEEVIEEDGSDTCEETENSFDSEQDCDDHDDIDCVINMAMNTTENAENENKITENTKCISEAILLRKVSASTMQI